MPQRQYGIVFDQNHYFMYKLKNLNGGFNKNTNLVLLFVKIIHRYCIEEHSWRFDKTWNRPATIP